MDDSPKKDRTWLYVGAAFVVCWVAYLAFLMPKTAPEGPDPPRLGGTGLPLPADYGWPLQDLDGNPFSLETFKGRPIVLNLWATWCGPCREEMPSLVRLAADPRVKGVAFLCVTNEPNGRQVKDYARSEMAGLTVLRSEDTPKVFQTEGIPATFVIAPDGLIVASEVGSARWDDPSVVAFLEALAKKAAPTRALPGEAR